jgi:transposase-like protein
MYLGIMLRIEQGAGQMGRKRHTAEEIIGKLRTAEIELAKGLGTAEVVRKLGITEQTYYRWRKEYGGLRLDQAKRLKELEKENTRLKKLVADQALDNAILKEVSSGKY